jgi:hypothetical protein
MKKMKNEIGFHCLSFAQLLSIYFNHSPFQTIWLCTVLLPDICLSTSSLAKGYDPLYSSSPLASLDGFSRSHGDGLYVMQLVVAATNQNALYKKHIL